jgi:hypothetical protein
MAYKDEEFIDEVAWGEKYDLFSSLHMEQREAGAARRERSRR